MAGIDLAWALAARRAAAAALRDARPRALLYSTTTAALLWPEPGADPLRRPGGRQPPRRATGSGSARSSAAAWPPRRCWCRAARAASPRPRPRTPRRWWSRSRWRRATGERPAERDLAAVTYGANPHKKGLDRVLAAWRAARREGETLVVAGLAGRDEAGVRFAGLLPRPEYRALLARARVFVTAPRREDYGMAQLEALADGCLLVTTPAPGPYAALPLARVARSAAGGRRPRRRPPHGARQSRARLRRARPSPPWRRSRPRRWTPRSPRSCCRACSGDGCPGRRAARSCWPEGRARRPCGPRQTPAARSSAATTAATATARMIEPPRHRTTRGGGDARRVGADGELVAVGQHLGHDQRGQQRGRQQGDDGGEPPGQLPAAERERADALDERGDDRAEADHRPRGAGAHGALPGAAGTRRGARSRPAPQPGQRGEPGGEDRDARRGEGDERERDQRAGEGDAARAAAPRAAPRTAARGRTPGRRRPAPASPGRPAPSRRARRPPCRRARRRTASPDRPKR